MTAPHDRPTAAELVEAVEEWVRRTGVDGELPSNPFHARVAANMLAIVRRELELGQGQRAAHEERLARLGVADDLELAERIRDGGLDDRIVEVRALVWDSVRDKLAVANPKYLDWVED